MKCCSPTSAAPSSRTKTTARGRYRRVKSRPAKICWPRQFASSAKSSGCHRLQAPFHSLGEVKQKAGKIVHAWAVVGDFDPAMLRSNTFELEWPPGSGQLKRFPEIDCVGWFGAELARTKIISSQVAFLERLDALTLAQPT